MKTKQKEGEFPGLFTIVRCLGPICDFLGKSQKEFLEENQLKCKKLESKITNIHHGKIEKNYTLFKEILKNYDLVQPSIFYLNIIY